MIPAPLSCSEPSRCEPLEDWPQLDQRQLQPSRSHAVCLTCHFFRHHPGADGIPVLTCHLHQGRIGRGQHLIRRCLHWTQELHRQRGWAPEAG